MTDRNGDNDNEGMEMTAANRVAVFSRIPRRRQHTLLTPIIIIIMMMMTAKAPLPLSSALPFTPAASH